MQTNIVYNDDCMNIMPTMLDNSVDLTLTDIPYDDCNMSDNGLRTIDKGKADIITFDINSFIEQLYRITKGTIIIFCSQNQLSEIYIYFKNKQLEGKGTVRQLIWNKLNPSPMNGEFVYLSGIENAIWFKKSNGTFNAYCKNTVFSYPRGNSELHPTEKNHLLLKELVLDNSNENDVVFDPCCGSGSHLLIAKLLKRQYLGIELNNDWFKIADNRLKYCDATNIDLFNKQSKQNSNLRKLF